MNEKKNLLIKNVQCNKIYLLNNLKRNLATTEDIMIFS